jgi:hypothetical protein
MKHLVKEDIEYIAYNTRRATYDCLPWLKPAIGTLSKLGFLENIQAVRLKGMMWIFNDGSWMDK